MYLIVLFLGLIMIAINLCVALLFGYYQINDAMKEMYELDEENDDNDDNLYNYDNLYNDDNLYNTVDLKGDLLLG